MKKVIAIFAILSMAIAVMSCSSNNSNAPSKSEVKKNIPHVLPEVVISASITDENLPTDINIHHPELKPGERFLCNISGDVKIESDGSIILLSDENEIEYNIQDIFNHHIGYHTKRIGNVAYDKSGNIVPSGHPIFVSINEK